MKEGRCEIDKDNRNASGQGWTTGLTWRLLSALASAGRYRDATEVARDTLRRRGRPFGDTELGQREDHKMIVMAAQAVSTPMRFQTRDCATGAITESRILTPLRVVIDAVRILDTSPLVNEPESLHWPHAPPLWQFGNRIRWGMAHQPSQVLRLSSNRLQTAEDVLERTAHPKYSFFEARSDALQRYGLRGDISRLQAEASPRRERRSVAADDSALGEVQRLLLRPRTLKPTEYELNVMQSHDDLQALLRRQKS